MFALKAETLAAAKMCDLVEFRAHLAFRTVNHGSAFATSQLKRRISEVDAEIVRRTNVLEICS